jgi:hypothetical protein
MLRDFPHRQHGNRKVYHVQEATTVDDVLVCQEYMQLWRIGKQTTKPL